MPTELAQGKTGLAMLLFRDDFTDKDYDPKELFERFMAWAEKLENSGKLVAANPLGQGGKTVRRRGAGIVVDGPYAEGREAVLGYFIVRVASFEEALAIAEECPHSQVGGATEVRELKDFPFGALRA